MISFHSGFLFRAFMILVLISSVIWALYAFYTTNSIYKSLVQLKKQYDELSKYIPPRKMQILPLHYSENGEFLEPTTKYEVLRRRLQENIEELSNYINSKLHKIQDEVASEMPEVVDKINEMQLQANEHGRSLVHDMEKLRHVDGFEAFRQKESKQLSELVQHRLHYLQNPKDCDSARKLLCNLKKNCGFACKLHHVVYCLIMSYATERTLILKPPSWCYNKAGWNHVFQPLSDTCHDATTTNMSYWPDRPDIKVLQLPNIEDLYKLPAFLPPAVPYDLAPRLRRLHGNPRAWWIGQFLKYLVRPQPHIADYLNYTLVQLGWKQPIVGVHIRRSDKYQEARMYNVDEYMMHVEQYYLTLEINGQKVPRRLFIATDDPSAIDEIRNSYSQYEIIANMNAAEHATTSAKRCTTIGLYGIIADIHLLSRSDYLVCTFSSQFCRVAYELMQSLNADAAHRFKSLDDNYYFGGQNAHYKRVVVEHMPRRPEEIYLVLGNFIEIRSNSTSIGFSQGHNINTNETGEFPSFKVAETVDVDTMPTYPNVH